MLHLTVCCTEQNATINFYSANADSRQIAHLTHIKHFLLAVFTIIEFPFKIDVRLFIGQYISNEIKYDEGWKTEIVKFQTSAARHKLLLREVLQYFLQSCWPIWITSSGHQKLSDNQITRAEKNLEVNMFDFFVSTISAGGLAPC